MKRLIVLCLAACGPKNPPVPLTDQCPAQASGDYDDVTEKWTREGGFRKEYEDSAKVHATFRSPDWRVAHAIREAELRQLTGNSRNALIQQACADMAGNYEIEVMLTTWDRRENCLDRTPARCGWTVALIDDQGVEHQPLEIVKDRRPTKLVRAEYPALGEFATPYIARFKRDPEKAPILGPNVRKVRLVMSNPRGTMQVSWSTE
jgi:hypothetical protein